MANFSLQVQPRTILGKQVRQLRVKDRIPGIVYGRGIPSRPVEFDRREFLKIWKGAGESTLLDLAYGSETPVKVLIVDVNRDPVSDRVIHVDFHQVRMEDKITAEIELSFVGEAPAVKELGGVLVKSLNQVKVSCLPGDLIASVEVDLSPLKTFEDYIYVKNLTIPSTIKVLERADEVVVTVVPPRSEEELEALKEKPVEEIEQVERVEKEKKEEEVPEEGKEQVKEKEKEKKEKKEK